MGYLSTIFLSGTLFVSPVPGEAPKPHKIGESHVFLLPRPPRPNRTPEDDKTPRQKRRGRNATTFRWDGEGYTC